MSDRDRLLASCEAWKERFALTLHCRLCGTAIDLPEVSPTLDLTAHMTRMVLVMVPDGCPGCKSLQVVK